jgi:hypothetical protein
MVHQLWVARCFGQRGNDVFCLLWGVWGCREQVKLLTDAQITPDRFIWVDTPDAVLVRHPLPPLSPPSPLHSQPALCDVLCCAVLCCAVLCCAVLCCAVLCCAVQLDRCVGRRIDPVTGKAYHVSALPTDEAIVKRLITRKGKPSLHSNRTDLFVPSHPRLYVGLQTTTLSRSKTGWWSFTSTSTQ